MSLLQAQAAPLKMDSSSPSKHRISSNIPGVDPFKKQRHNTSHLAEKQDLTPVFHFHLK